MALGNKKANGNLLVLKPVFQANDGSSVQPYFKVRRKVDGVWTDDKDGVPNVVGDVTKLVIKDGEYQGKKFKDIALFLEDKAERETYIVNLRFNMATRSLFNALLNLTEFDNVSVSVYQDKKSGFGRYGLWQNDTLVRWKHELDALPEVEEATLGGKVIRDYTNIDRFFEEELNAWAKTIPHTKRASSTSHEEADHSAEVDEDDIPF